MISNKRELYKTFALFVIAAVAATMLFASPAWAQAVLDVEKVADPESVAVGEELTYTITVENVGNTNATSVTLTDPLPTDTEFISVETDTVGAACIPLTGGATTGTVNCNLGTILPNGIVTVTLVVEPMDNGTVTNRVTVDSPDTADPDKDILNTTVTDSDGGGGGGGGGGDSDLTITKDDDQDPVEVDEDLTYTLTVENDGDETVNDVTVIDRLPNDVDFVSDDGNCDKDGRDIECDLGAIGAGGEETVEIVVEPTEEGTTTNRAFLFVGDEEIESERVTEDTDVEDGNGDNNNDNDNDGINDNNDNDDDNDGIADSADTVDNAGEATVSTDQEGTTSDIEQTVSNSTADQYADTGEGTTGTGARASVGPDGPSAQAGGASAQEDPDEQAPVNQRQSEQYGGEVVDEVQTTGPLPETGGASVAAGTSLALVLFGVLLLAVRLVAGWRERS